MKELVVGIDSSPDSRRALRWAAAVADCADVPVRAVEAWSFPPLTAVPQWRDLVVPDEMDALTVEDIRAVITDELGDIPRSMSAAALRGPAARALLRAVGPGQRARARQPWPRRLRRAAARVGERECVEHAPCPVVIAREDELPTAGDTVVLVGKDGSENAARALEWADAMGQLTGAAVVAVYAWQSTSSEVKPKLHQRLRAEAAATIEQWISDGGHRAGSLETEGDPRTKLVQLAARMDAKLVVVGRRGTSRLRGLRTGGVSSYLISNCPTTVAVIPPKART
jgi:nucleotide-binding universal stress UspA family protein